MKLSRVYAQPVEPYDILEANDVFETLYASSQNIPFAFLPIITSCCVIISIGILTMPEFKIIFVKKILWKKHHSIFPYRSSQRSYLSTEKVTLNNKNKLIVIIFYCGNRMYAFSIDSSTWRSIKYKFLKIPKLWLKWGKSSFSPEVAQFTGHELFLPTYMSISSTQ